MQRVADGGQEPHLVVRSDGKGFAVTLRDFAWEWCYAPVARAVSWASDTVNPLQFLTIRRYLTLMFAALVLLLSIIALAA